MSCENSIAPVIGPATLVNRFGDLFPEPLRSLVAYRVKDELLDTEDTVFPFPIGSSLDLLGCSFHLGHYHDKNQCHSDGVEVSEIDSLFILRTEVGKATVEKIAVNYILPCPCKTASITFVAGQDTLHFKIDNDLGNMVLSTRNENIVAYTVTGRRIKSLIKGGLI